MKKRFAPIALLAAALLMASCVKSGGKPVKIGIAAPQADNAWLEAAAYYAQSYCAENGIHFSMTVSEDAAQMNQNLRKLADEGCTGIVVWSPWPGVEHTVQELADAGVNMVCFHRDMPCRGVYKVTGDSYDMGYRCAQYITDTVGDGAHIVVLDVPSSGSVCAQRKKGFYDYLKIQEYDVSNILEYQLDGFTREEGASAMAYILAANAQIDGVFAMEDAVAMGVVQALREAGRTGVKAITGGGGCREYLRMIGDPQYEDLGLATALYSPAMVEDAIRVAVKLANSESSDPVVVIPTAMVMGGNLNDYLDEGDPVY